MRLVECGLAGRAMDGWRYEGDAGHVPHNTRHASERKQAYVPALGGGGKHMRTTLCCNRFQDTHFVSTFLCSGALSLRKESDVRRSNIKSVYFHICPTSRPHATVVDSFSWNLHIDENTSIKQEQKQTVCRTTHNPLCVCPSPHLSHCNTLKTLSPPKDCKKKKIVRIVLSKPRHDVVPFVDRTRYLQI